MMLLSFPVLVQRFAAQARASAGVALDFSVGSIWRAIAEASSSVALWLQWLILIVLRQTRLSTSIGSEVDSWIADYGMTRLPSVAATGTVTFGRITTGTAAFIPVGATCRTTDGTQSFGVVADPTNAAWTGVGYALAAATPSVALPVQAISAGAAGNVMAGSITVLTSAIAGVDTVTNQAPCVSGADAESDAAVRARFGLFVDSRSRGTASAVAFAIASLQQGLTFKILENTLPDGTFQAGFFTVVVDDGSGSPSAALLATVQGAIDAVRPVGTSLAVQPPVVAPAVVSLTITAAPGYLKTNLAGPVAAAILGYIDGLTIGQVCSYFRIAAVANDVPGVAEIDSLLLNGGPANVGGGPTQVVRGTLANTAVN